MIFQELNCQEPIFAIFCNSLVIFCYCLLFSAYFLLFFLLFLCGRQERYAMRRPGNTGILGNVGKDFGGFKGLLCFPVSKRLQQRRPKDQGFGNNFCCRSALVEVSLCA